MLSDGVIDQAKHDEFLARAMQTCAGMFPPESGGTDLLPDSPGPTRFMIFGQINLKS